MPHYYMCCSIRHAICLVQFIKKFTIVFQGVESISDYAISFHYVTPQLMNDLEFFVYHLRPYGILNELQNLNGQTA